MAKFSYRVTRDAASEPLTRQLGKNAVSSGNGDGLREATFANRAFAPDAMPASAAAATASICFALFMFLFMAIVLF
jgi:hypothetical protein